MHKGLFAIIFLSIAAIADTPMVLQGHALPLGGRKLNITQTQPLKFGVVISGAPMDIVINALDPGAAVFMAQGDQGEGFAVQMTRKRTWLRNRSGKGSIKVDGFTYGGDINNRGIGVFNRGKQLSNIRIGAVAHMNASARRGSYTGKIRLRITYIG